MKKSFFVCVFLMLAVFCFSEGMADHIEEINNEYSTADIQNLRNLILEKYKICVSLSSEDVQFLINAVNTCYLLPMVNIDTDYYLGSIIFELALKHPSPFWETLDYNGRIAVVSRMIPELKYIRYMDNKSVENPVLLRNQ